MPGLLEAIAGLSGVRVAVLGDVMLDRYVIGVTERISPEAPIPVIKIVREQTTLGGAANVARNVISLGGEATLVGLIGLDEAGAELETAAAREKRLTPYLVRDASRPTTIKTRFLAQGQQLLRVDRESTTPASDPAAEAMVDAIRRAIDNASILVLSDYAKGALSPAVIGAAIAYARSRGRPVIVDPKQRDMRCYASATVVTPNAAEAAAATGIDCSNDDGVIAAARAIGESVNCSHVVVTRGDKGMTILDVAGGSAPIHLPAIVQEVNDVSGAGDTVLAALALGLGAGAQIETAARLANMAAAIAVSHRGTAAVTAEELTIAAQDAASRTGRTKIVSCAHAASLAAEWREKGRSVVFTNGCFDLLHPGHVRLLQQAKAEGDKLIVALNSDASVRRLKGPSRPIQGEEARAFVMASMESVDLVIIFDEDTPLAAIKAIRPDVLVKGADYTLAQVVGADEVQLAGGRVVRVLLEEGHSTTASIERAARAAE